MCSYLVDFEHGSGSMKLQQTSEESHDNNHSEKNEASKQFYNTP